MRQRQLFPLSPGRLARSRFAHEKNSRTDRRASSVFSLLSAQIFFTMSDECIVNSLFVLTIDLCRKPAFGKVGVGELDRIGVVRDVRGDRGQHEVLSGSVEGIRENDQRGRCLLGEVRSVKGNETRTMLPCL